jgi:hypothetical protein
MDTIKYFDETGFDNSYFDEHIQIINKASGTGGHFNHIQNFMVELDRYAMNDAPPNHVTRGLAFITCPTLNLQSTNIKTDRILSMLNTTNPNSIAFAIRCLLDTRWRAKYGHIASKSQLVNLRNPFMIPLTNGLRSMSGWPDYGVQTFTTEGGYHNENQTFVIGSDELSGTYDISCSFKDVSGGPIMALFLFWLRYMGLQCTGRVLNHGEDIDNQRMPYTVSIYRFMLDPTRRYIVSYAKATGCFPKNVPIGAQFNINEDEIYVKAATNFSIPFAVNKVEYNDPGIILDFNRLMTNFCPNIKELPLLSRDPFYNYRGLPYIETIDAEMSLQFRSDDSMDIPRPVTMRNTQDMDQTAATYANQG